LGHEAAYNSLILITEGTTFIKAIFCELRGSDYVYYPSFFDRL